MNEGSLSQIAKLESPELALNVSSHLESMIQLLTSFELLCSSKYISDMETWKRNQAFMTSTFFHVEHSHGGDEKQADESILSQKFQCVCFLSCHLWELFLQQALAAASPTFSETHERHKHSHTQIRACTHTCIWKKIKVKEVCALRKQFFTVFSCVNVLLTM